MTGAVLADSEPLSASALLQIEALQQEKASFTPAEQKMDSQLVFAFKQSHNQIIAKGAVPQMVIAANADAQGMISVDIKANVSANLLQQIQNLGGVIINSFAQFNSIRASVPLNQVENIAGLADVKFIRPAMRAVTHNSDPEGVVTHRDDVARGLFHVDGSNVKVGVISDSVDFLASVQALGDVGPVTVLPGQSGVPGTGEGTAMLEIVHAMAPGAQLYFATAFNGEAQFAQNILNLRAAGCDIIVDDVGYFDESPFQDGIVAQAVNTVTESGALYFSSAGNEGNLDSGTSGTWEGDFANGGAAAAPITATGNIHSFGAAAYDTVTQPGAATWLFWSDPAGASTNDYDLYILDSTGANVVASSITVQNGSQDPYEFIGTNSSTGQRVVIFQHTNAAARFLYTTTYRGQFAIGTDGNTVGHSAATNAFSVAATYVGNSYPNAFNGGKANPVETFSSDGPRQVFYHADGTPVTPGNFLSTGGAVRQKPDITAADGVTTSVPGFAPFFGTSAAAPHAAAIAALLKSYSPQLTPAQIRNIFTNATLDIMAPGLDRNSGFGIVMADRVLAAAPVPAPAPFIGIVTNILSGGNGNGIIDLNECNSLDIILTNSGSLGATNIQATLFTSTPGATIAQPTSLYPDLPVGGFATNKTSFKISTSPLFVCGTPINFTLVVKSDENTTTNVFSLSTGIKGTPVRFDNNSVVTIPENNGFGANSSIIVSNILGTLQHVAVSLNISQPFVGDLTLELLGPDGTTNILSKNNGGFGSDYGLACSPDSNRTTFDDDAGTPIGTAFPPFAGTFQPDSPLAVFIGKSGGAVNGRWRLRAIDPFNNASGAIECWSLILSPTACSDGGGQCPGIDLALGMSAEPSPVIIGSNLTYSITVTNNGPDTATNVALSQTLPPGVIFVSAVASQGICSQVGNLVSCTLGSLNVGATDLVTVVVFPTQVGTIYSTATVGAEQHDLIPTNNSATVATVVQAPFADLAAAITSAPNPVGVGSVVTYTVMVVNNGLSPASGIQVTTTLPPGINPVSAISSQGTCASSGDLVTCTLGSLPLGGSATVTIQALATQVGSFSATATVSGLQNDPVPGNNTATALTTVTPAADLVLSMSGTPSSAIVGSNVTYQLTVRNFGPSPATLVNVNDTLPGNVMLVSAISSQGPCAVSGSLITCTITNLAAGASAGITITAGTAPLAGLVPITITNTASAGANEADPNPANNVANVATFVNVPSVNVVSAGAVLTAESFTPTNGMIDLGETVTLSLGLQNLGNIDTTGNVVATLLATNGVILTGGAQVQDFGFLPAAGSPVSRPFTFTAGGNNGGTIIATLQLKDGTDNLGTANFAFTLPSVTSFASTNNIIIPDHGPGQPYPSAINVSGLSGLVGKVTVTLTNVNHTFPDDIDMLLVGPSGQENVLLMSHAGGRGVLTNVSLTFDDAAGSFLPPSSQILSGAFEPSQYGTVNLTNNTPPLPSPPAPPFGSTLSSFNGTVPNGTWYLYVFDSSPGDGGIILGGWSVAIASGTPVNPIVDLALSGTSTPSPALVNSNLTYTFTIVNNGPNPSSGSAFTNILPANVNFVSVTNSARAVCSTNANGAVYCLLGSLPVGTNVTVTVVVNPIAAGSVSSQATVTGVDSDPNQSNNSITVQTAANEPVADLGVTLSGAPNPVHVGGNLVYTITVTNQGPGAAFGVVVTDPLGSLNFVSGISSSLSGNVFVSNNAAICNLGNFAPGAGAVVTLTVQPTLSGLITNTAVATTASTDPNLTNNTASTGVTVTNQAPNVVAAGASLLSGNPLSPTGEIDSGETVTVSLLLTNAGSADTTNLVATLLSGNGVTAPSGPQTYGRLIHGGAAVPNSYTFTAEGANGGIIGAVLQLSDGGATNLGTVTFNFNLPATNLYLNAGQIIIPDHGPGNPYPSSTNISGLTGVVSKVTVTINNLNHQFANDVNILLVGPSGQRAVLMSGTGGATAVTNATLTFDDAATNSLPASTRALAFLPIISGTFKPTSFIADLSFPNPAPAGPYVTSLGVFSGTVPNGTWSLFVLDSSPGDNGVIAGGWSLDIASVNPVNGAADLGVTLATATHSALAGYNFTYLVNVTNKGPATATGMTLTDTLPAGVAFVATSAGNYTNANGVLTLSLESLAAGGSANFTITANAAAKGLYTNVINLSANEVDLNLADNSAQNTIAVAVPVAFQLSTGAYKANGSFALTLTGQPGQTYVIQASSDLSTWTPVSTNIASFTGVFQFTDLNASGFPRRYYRATLAP